MKILFYHPEYILDNQPSYNDIDKNNITLSELKYNDNFKYINIYYNDSKIIIKTPVIENYIIDKFSDYYILKINISYVKFLVDLEKYIIKKSIKQLNNWFTNNKYFYSSVFNFDDDTFEIKIYNNELDIDDIYSNYINKIYFKLSLDFQIYGIWIDNKNNNETFIGIYNKYISINI